MDAILHHIRRGDGGLIELTVALGTAAPRVFRANYDGSNDNCLSCSFDEELFMALSELAYRRFGNCAVYQFELMKLVGVFCDGGALPPLPVALGTTSYCTLKPSAGRVLWNRLRILLSRLGRDRPTPYAGPANDEAV